MADGNEFIFVAVCQIGRQTDRDRGRARSQRGNIETREWLNIGERDLEPVQAQDILDSSSVTFS